MNKNQYISPVVIVTRVNTQSLMLQNSVASVSGLDGVEKANVDFAGGAVDVKRSDYNVWGDDWSK